MVNEQIFRGHWTELRSSVKERWPALTDDDLVLAEGNPDDLVGIIERRTGDPRESIEQGLHEITMASATLSEQIRARAAAAYAGAGTYADDATRLAQQQYEQLQQQYEQIAANLRASVGEAEQAIKRNPIESICVAFGTGLVAGVVAGLMLRPKR